MTATAPRLVLVGGHESGQAADLVRFEGWLPRAVAVRPGRRLHDLVSSAVADGETVVVVPMTFGRDPVMVADVATTLRWVSASHQGSVALAAPFGALDHLTARLRATAGAAHARDAEAALVIAAPASNPFDDAELHRVAHLVRVHGSGIEVAVATLPADRAGAAVGVALQRLRMLGFERTVVVPAGFGRGVEVDAHDPAFAGMSQPGPLISDSAVARVVIERVEAARHDLQHGRDGIEAGLGAAHGHGFAHSHGPADDHDHTHSRTHHQSPTPTREEGRHEQQEAPVRPPVRGHQDQRRPGERDAAGLQHR